MRVSQPGQLWPPTRIEDWWVIVRLEKFMPAQLDEAMRRRLLEELFLAWLQEESQKFEVLQSEVTPAQVTPAQVAPAQATPTEDAPNSPDSAAPKAPQLAT